MSINFTNLSAVLQAKINAITQGDDEKKLLLLAKAVESAVGNIAVSDVANKGDEQVARVLAKGNEEVAAVGTAGTTQVAAVNAEGAARLQSLQAFWNNVTQGAPAALDTLAELAAALANDANFAASVTTALAAKANSADVTTALAAKANTSDLAGKLDNTGGTTTGKVILAGSATSLAAVLVNAAEKISISTSAASGTINFDVTSQSLVFNSTAASANFTLNVRASASATLNSVMSVGESVTVGFLNTNGGTGYYLAGLQIDGVNVTPKWQGGATPTSGNSNAVDSYTLLIVKTGDAAFIVLASQVKFA